MCRLKLSSVTSRHSAASEWLKPQIKPAYPLALKRRRLAAGLIYVIAHIYLDAVTQARTLKPAIPLIADNGIPIRDEIEMERMLP